MHNPWELHRGPRAPARAREVHDPSRRVFLQGSGAVIALPFLASLGSRRARAASATLTPPTRFVSYFVPLGMLSDSWMPSDTGRNYTLSPTLQPLAALQDKFSVISGTTNEVPNMPGPGGGHANGTGMFATASRIGSPKNPPTAGISCDQLVAQAIGNDTRLQSMQMACADSIFGDGVFSSTYTSVTSWSSSTSPLPPVTSPATLFRRLFPAGQVQGTTANKASYAAQRDVPVGTQASILDAAVGQAQALQKKLGRADAALLDQFLTGVRQVERALGTGGTTSTRPGPPGSTTLGVPESECGTPSAPASTSNGDFVTQLPQFAQLMTLAFACDQTRVISFMFANGESSRSYKNLGYSAQHHPISHYDSGESAMGSDDAKKALRKIQVYEMQCFAGLLSNLQAVQESNGTLLDNCVIVLSSELSDSMHHTYTNMPALIAGGGSGRIKGLGQHIAMPTTTHFSQVLLTGIRACGVDQDSFGTLGETGSIPGML